MVTRKKGRGERERENEERLGKCKRKSGGEESVVVLERRYELRSGKNMEEER